MKVIRQFSIIFLLSFYVQGVFAQNRVDSLPNIPEAHNKPSYVLQFLAGNIAYAIPFWTLSGIQYINNGDSPLGGVFLGIIATGLAVPLTGNIDGHCSGSYWAGIGGAFLGQLIAGPLYRYVGDHNNSIAAQYLALSLPPVLLSILFYQLLLTEEDYNQTSSKVIFIVPSLSNYHGCINLKMRF